MGMTPQLPIRGVILDWAGTTVDYGSLAPARVFVEIFRQRGIEITVAEARGPMGRSKPDHIWEILTLPRVSAIWQTRNGRAPQTSDVQALYTDFLPLQKATLQQKSDVIPGVPEAIRKLRAQGLKIGSSTGYTRELMEIVAPIAALRGYAPDVLVSIYPGTTCRLRVVEMQRDQTLQPDDSIKFGKHLLCEGLRCY